MHVHRERSARREQNRTICMRANPDLDRSNQKMRLQGELGNSIEMSEEPAFARLDKVRRSLGTELQKQIEERRRAREKELGKELAEGMAYQQSISFLRKKFEEQEKQKKQQIRDEFRADFEQQQLTKKRREAAQKVESAAAQRENKRLD